MAGKKKNPLTTRQTPVPTEHGIPPRLANELKQFMEYAQPRRLSRNLRGLLLSMLIAQKDGYIFDLEELLSDLAFLFNLLDSMEDAA